MSALDRGARSPSVNDDQSGDSGPGLPARRTTAVLPTATQLAQDHPDLSSVLGDYLQSPAATLVQGDETLLSASVGAYVRPELSQAWNESAVEYLTSRTVDAEATRLTGRVDAVWSLEEDSTRPSDGGTVRQLTFSSQSSSPSRRDALRIVIGPARQVTGTVVRITHNLEAAGTQPSPVARVLAAYEEDFAFRPPAGCVPTRLSLGLTTYNPRVPLSPSVIATWGCPGLGVPELQSAVMAAAAADPRFVVGPWVASGSDQIAKFEHGDGAGSWRVGPAEGAYPADIQLDLDPPTV